MNDKIKLFSIRFSHFNEKVRWFLDLNNVAYTEISVFPVFHFLVRPLFGPTRKSDSDRSSTRFSTPVINHENKCVSDSDEICLYVQKNLLGEDVVAKVPEGRFNNSVDLFEHVRRFGYSQILPRPDLVHFMAFNNYGFFQACLFRLFRPLVKFAIYRGFNIHDKSIDRSEKYIRDEFDRMSFLLESKNRGGDLTYEDICFAAAAGPALLVSFEEGYAGYLPPVSESSERYQKLVDDLRSTPAGKFCLDLFKNQRGKRRIEYRKNWLSSLLFT